MEPDYTGLAWLWSHQSKVPFLSQLPQSTCSQRSPWARPKSTASSTFTSVGRILRCLPGCIQMPDVPGIRRMATRWQYSEGHGIGSPATGGGLGSSWLLEAQVQPEEEADQVTHSGGPHTFTEHQHLVLSSCPLPPCTSCCAPGRGAHPSSSLPGQTPPQP